MNELGDPIKLVDNEDKDWKKLTHLSLTRAWAADDLVWDKISKKF